MGTLPALPIFSLGSFHRSSISPLGICYFCNLKNLKINRDQSPLDGRRGSDGRPWHTPFSHLLGQAARRGAFGPGGGCPTAPALRPWEPGPGGVAAGRAAAPGLTGAGRGGAAGAPARRGPLAAAARTDVRPPSAPLPPCRVFTWRRRWRRR